MSGFYGFFQDPLLDLEVFGIALLIFTVWGIFCRLFLIERKK